VVSIHQIVRLKWYGSFTVDEVHTSDFRVFENIEGFYMFLNESKILYIGQVYFKSLRRRIEEHLRGDSLWRWIKRNYGSKNVTVKISEIENLGQERITKELVNDIECLLIGLQEPEGNIQGKVTYGGRDLKIVNLGKRNPLPKTLSTDMLE
jgi:hypothetical protein